jgi:hypothetical protein
MTEQRPVSLPATVRRDDYRLRRSCHRGRRGRDARTHPRPRIGRRDVVLDSSSSRHLFDIRADVRLEPRPHRREPIIRCDDNIALGVAVSHEIPPGVVREAIGSRELIDGYDSIVVLWVDRDEDDLSAHLPHLEHRLPKSFVVPHLGHFCGPKNTG